MIETIKDSITDSIHKIVGWRQIRDTKFSKQWVKGNTKVEVRVVGGGAQALHYDRTKSRRERVNTVLTNGKCTVPEAVWLAKLYMNYDMTIPACPLRVEHDEGIKFTSVKTSLIKSFTENNDKDEKDAVKEFLKLANEGKMSKIQEVANS
jgi:hypothetical protein